jgi:hypothetical protein
LLELGKLKPQQRRALQERYQSLDPVKLRHRIEQLRAELFDLLERDREPVLPKARRDGPNVQIQVRKAQVAR